MAAVLARLDLTTPDPCPADDGAPEWNAWLYACTDRLKSVVAEVAKQAINAEQVLKAFRRARARRPVDLAVFMATIEALVVHVTYEYLRGAGPVRLTLDNNVLDKKSRYLSRLHSSQLPKIIALLGSPDLAFLNVVKGTAPTPFSAGRQTRISAGPCLVSRLDGIELDDIDCQAGEEVVMLKRLKDDTTGIAALKEYDDTELTTEIRADVRELNEFLKQADVRYMGELPLVDERDRHLRRYFTRGDWLSCGRLFGGFWQPFKKAHRLANILINSEEVASVDFDAMILQTAYAYAQVMPPAGDLYSLITFTSTSGSTVVLPRRVVKKIVAARFNGAKDWPKELREYRPGLSWSAVVSSLKASHPALAEFFDLDIGQRLMFTESEILVDALFKLKSQSIVALPVHDCVVVAESDTDAAVTAMLESFHFTAHQVGRVSVETAPKE